MGGLIFNYELTVDIHCLTIITVKATLTSEGSDLLYVAILYTIIQLVQSGCRWS